MLQQIDRPPYVFDTPASYTIQVAASLPVSWSDILGGMTITVDYESEEGCLTTLSGLLPDQVALAGVLETISSFGLPLLSVQRGEDVWP